MEVSIIVYFLVVVSILYAIYRIKTKRIRDVTEPIPGGESFIILALKVIFFGVKSAKGKKYRGFYDVLTERIRRFPNISKIWVGPLFLIDVRHPEYVKRVLNSDKCIDRASFYFFPYKTGLLYSGGDQWTRHRKLLNPAFSTLKVNDFMPMLDEKARKFTEVLDGYVGKKPFNVARPLSALTLESLLRTSFGLEKDFINNPNHRFFTAVKKEAASIARNIQSGFNLFSLSRTPENEFSDNCQKFMMEAKNNIGESNFYNRRNFIEILLDNKAHFTDRNVLDEVCTLILTGNASTAMSMSSVLLMLGMHHDVQEKVVAELLDVFHDSDENINIDNINKLQYLDLVIKETLRLFPIAPIIGRKATSDWKLDENYTLPKGANLVIRIFDVQRNPAWWGDDASEFKPERFLPHNLNKIHPYAFIPFAAGPRICIGHRYALSVMKIVLINILRKFRISTDLKYHELKLEISFILKIFQNYMILIQRR